MTKDAYLCIVTWPDGTEGLLFPRPGNVPIADTEERGWRDFQTAERHLKEFMADVMWDAEHIRATKIRLIKFQAMEVIAEYSHQ